MSLKGVEALKPAPDGPTAQIERLGLFEKNHKPVLESNLGYQRTRIWAAACLGVALLILLVTGGFAFAEWQGYHAARARVVRTRATVTAATKLMSALKDAETGQRGYLLTGDLRYLKPYETAVTTVSQQEAELLDLLASSPAETVRAAEIRRLLPAKMSELAATVALRRSGDAQGAITLVRSDSGKDAMDGLRNALAGVQLTENSAFDHQMQTVRERANTARVITMAGSGLMFLFLCGATLIITRAEKDRDRFVEALSASNSRTHAALELLEITLSSIGDAVIATDIDSRVTFMNPVAESLTKWTRDEAAGIPLDKVFVIVNETSGKPVENPAVRALREGVVQGLANHTILIGRDGSTHPIDDSAAPIRDQNGKIVGVVLVFRDISSRHEAERRIRESEAFNRSILENSTDPILVLDANGRVLARPDGTRAAAAWNLSRMVGLDWRDLWGLERGEEADTILRAAAGGRVGRMQSYSASFDGVAKWWDVTVSPVKGETGDPVAFVSTARDITAIKEVEIRIETAYARERAAHQEAESARQQLARQAAELARSNADLERFAFAASHDLQEPLRTVVAYTQLFLRRNKHLLDADGITYLDFVTDAAKRMSTLIRDLLTYSQVLKAAPFHPEPVDTDQVLNQVIGNCAVLIAESHARVDRGLMPVIPGRESQLIQIFQNLLTNAIRYRRTEVRPEISVSAVDRGQEWLFEIQDNGSGIEARYLTQIFDMFRRFSKREHSGTGLGLALCQRIIESHGGKIWVESEVGAGSRFFFTWPKKIESHQEDPSLPAALDS